MCHAKASTTAITTTTPTTLPTTVDRSLPSAGKDMAAAETPVMATSATEEDVDAEGTSQVTNC
jgi:hypothetical protein